MKDNDVTGIKGKEALFEKYRLARNKLGNLIDGWGDFDMFLAGYECAVEASPTPNVEPVRVELGRGMFGIHYGTLEGVPCLNISDKGVGIVGKPTNHKNLTELELEREVITISFLNKESYTVFKKIVDSIPEFQPVTRPAPPNTTDHQELLKIHEIIMGIADCPPITDDDTYTVKGVKNMAYMINSMDESPPNTDEQEIKRLREYLESIIKTYDRHGNSISKLSKHELIENLQIMRVNANHALNTKYFCYGSEYEQLKKDAEQPVYNDFFNWLDARCLGMVITEQMLRDEFKAMKEVNHE